MDRLVYRIARNLIIDHYRRGRQTEALPPEPYRGALIATEYEGLTQAQLAQREGISLPAAKSRVQRARTKLKEELLACCHFELDRHGGIIDYYERCCSCRSEGCVQEAARPLPEPR